jgi:Fe-Mn family superoxide dismutase
MHAMPYTLPELPYDHAALEPTIDAETMQLHHGKHHQAYVDKANDAVAGTPLDGVAIEEAITRISELPQDKQGQFRNNGGGHANHSLFWESMTPGGASEPSGELADAITAKFGSFDDFKAQFEANGVAQFGSGWTWLVVRGGEIDLAKTPNQDSPLMDGATPLLGNDVWEHAYYLTYRNRRPEYLKSWWAVVNWDVVAQRYAAAKG